MLHIILVILKIIGIILLTYTIRKDFEKIKKQLQKSYFFSILISYGKNGAFPDQFVFHSLGVVFHLE